MSRTRKGNHGHPRRISATELAALGRCEQQAMFKHHGNRERVGTKVAAARSRGNAEHARRHEVIKRLENAPSNLDAAHRDRRCFIATAVYGADAWQTECLRAWRNERLLPRPLGRVLVHMYYRFSPVLARTLDRHPGATRLARRALDRWVSYLDEDGQS